MREKTRKRDRPLARFGWGFWRIYVGPLDVEKEKVQIRLVLASTFFDDGLLCANNVWTRSGRYMHDVLRTKSVNVLQGKACASFHDHQAAGPLKRGLRARRVVLADPYVVGPRALRRVLHEELRWPRYGQAGEPSSKLAC